MRGGAVGNGIVFSKKNLKEEGEIGKYIKYVYTLPTSELNEKKLSNLMVNLKSLLKYVKNLTKEQLDYGQTP